MFVWTGGYGEYSSRVQEYPFLDGVDCYVLNGDALMKDYKD
jgi:hypothetical protein